MFIVIQFFEIKEFETKTGIFLVRRAGSFLLFRFQQRGLLCDCRGVIDKKNEARRFIMSLGY